MSIVRTPKGSVDITMILLLYTVHCAFATDFEPATTLDSKTSLVNDDNKSDSVLTETSGHNKTITVMDSEKAKLKGHMKDIIQSLRKSSISDSTTQERGQGKRAGSKKRTKKEKKLKGKKNLRRIQESSGLYRRLEVYHQQQNEESERCLRWKPRPIVKMTYSTVNITVCPDGDGIMAKSTEVCLEFMNAGHNCRNIDKNVNCAVIIFDIEGSNTLKNLRVHPHCGWNCGWDRKTLCDTKTTVIKLNNSQALQETVEDVIIDTTATIAEDYKVLPSTQLSSVPGHDGRISMSTIALIVVSVAAIVVMCLTIVVAYRTISKRCRDIFQSKPPCHLQSEHSMSGNRSSGSCINHRTSEDLIQMPYQSAGASLAPPETSNRPRKACQEYNTMNKRCSSMCSLTCDFEVSNQQQSMAPEYHVSEKGDGYTDDLKSVQSNADNYMNVGENDKDIKQRGLQILKPNEERPYPFHPMPYHLLRVNPAVLANPAGLANGGSCETLSVSAV